MLIIPPPKFRKGRTAARRPVPWLTLVSAAFNADDAILELTFDRAIDITNIVVSQIQVSDGAIEMKRYDGAPDGASLTGPATLRLVMQEIGAASGGAITIWANAETEIVAISDGGRWLGADYLALPFPP